MELFAIAQKQSFAKRFDQKRSGRSNELIQSYDLQCSISFPMLIGCETALSTAMHICYGRGIHYHLGYEQPGYAGHVNPLHRNSFPHVHDKAHFTFESS